jgi:hypothetical protein
LQFALRLIIVVNIAQRDKECGHGRSAAQTVPYLLIGNDGKADTSRQGFSRPVENIVGHRRDGLAILKTQQPLRDLSCYTLGIVALCLALVWLAWVITSSAMLASAFLP